MSSASVPRCAFMSTEVTVSLGKLAEVLKKNEIQQLREELSKAKRVVFLAYRVPRFKPLKVRAPDKRLVELNNGIFNRLEYALFKTMIDSARNGRLPVFKDIADIASDYKATAKYLTLLAEWGLVVFPDPEKAAKLSDAIKVMSESKYLRRIRKVLDLSFVLNIKALEENASKLNCVYRDERLVCNYYSEDHEREQEKIQVNLFNEYLGTLK